MLVVITIVRWGYRPTYKWGAPHCRDESMVSKNGVNSTLVVVFGGVLINNLVVLFDFLSFYLYIVVGWDGVGWDGVGWANNVLVRSRHVLLLPTYLRHAASGVNSKYVVRYHLKSRLGKLK